MGGVKITLAAATAQAAAALQAGDLEGMTRALQARREALESGEKPAREDLESGERLLQALLELQKQAAFDSARLGQIQRYVDFRR